MAPKLRRGQTFLAAGGLIEGDTGLFDFHLMKFHVDLGSFQTGLTEEETQRNTLPWNVPSLF